METSGFVRDGNIALKNPLGRVWITSQWSDEFRIDFDIKMAIDIQDYTSGFINAIRHSKWVYWF